MKEELVARRSALKYLALLTATAAGRDFLAQWLPTASAATGPRDPGNLHGTHRPPPEEPAPPSVLQFFTPEESRTVEILTEMIIPADDAPGAKEAQVARYIDFVVYSAREHMPELQKRWTEGFRWLEQFSKEKYGNPFREMDAREREQLLTEMSLPEHDPKAEHPGFNFYRLVKDMTVEGFYTSRIGLLQVLEYKGLAYLPDFPGCTHPEHR